MTKASEVTVSVHEAAALFLAAQKGPIELREEYRRLIAARVPDASSNPYCGHAHNALRDAVLRGPQ